MSSTGGTGTPGRGLKRPPTPNQGQGQSNIKKRRFVQPYESPRDLKRIWKALSTAGSIINKVLWHAGPSQGHNGHMEDKDLYLVHDSRPNSSYVTQVTLSSSASSSSGESGSNFGAKKRFGRNLVKNPNEISNNDGKLKQNGGDDDEVKILEEESTTASAADLRFGNQLRHGLTCAPGTTTHGVKQANGKMLIQTKPVSNRDRPIKRRFGFVNPIQPEDYDLYKRLLLQSQGSMYSFSPTPPIRAGHAISRTQPRATNFARNFRPTSERGVSRGRSQVGKNVQNINWKVSKDKIMSVSPRDKAFKHPGHPKDFLGFSNPR